MANKRMSKKEKRYANLMTVVIAAMIAFGISALILSVIVLMNGKDGALRISAIATLIFNVFFWITGAILIAIDPSIKKTLSAPERELPEEVADMTGVEFEQYVVNLLDDAGWADIKTTPASGDHGADIIASKNGKRYAIQCKRYKQKVGTSAVHEIHSGKDFYDADYAVVITNSTYTPQARVLGEKIGVMLWELDMLDKLDEVGEANPKDQES